MIGEELAFDGSVLQRLRDEGVYIAKTSGFSMRPLFKTHRDAVMIVPPQRELRKYDIVLYTYDGKKYVLHRIVGFKGDVCLIRGDNTFVLERIPKDRILGVVASFNRKGVRYDMTELSYRFYSVFWTFIYPLRYLLYQTRRVLSKIKHAIFKRQK